MNGVIAIAPVATPCRLALLADPASGRVLEVLGTAPDVQVYTGNFLDGTIAGKGGTLYRQGNAICIEPQLFSDTLNRPAFGSARLDPGAVYSHVIVLRFSTSGG